MIKYFRTKIFVNEVVRLASLKNIAEKANVSVSTVSKAFSDSREISTKTRERILEIAKDLGVYDKYYKGKSNR